MNPLLELAAGMLIIASVFLLSFAYVIAVFTAAGSLQ